MEIRWSKQAQNDLKALYNYYKEKSPQSAEKIVQEIYDTVSTLLYSRQYQKDDINSHYRRMVCRHYKILYKETPNKKIIRILSIFDARQNPDKQID